MIFFFSCIVPHGNSHVTTAQKDAWPYYYTAPTHVQFSVTIFICLTWHIIFYYDQILCWQSKQVHPPPSELKMLFFFLLWAADADWHLFQCWYGTLKCQGLAGLIGTQTTTSRGDNISRASRAGALIWDLDRGHLESWHTHEKFRLKYSK